MVMSDGSSEAPSSLYPGPSKPQPLVSDVWHAACRLFRSSVAQIFVAYTIYILFGVICFVSHLGDDLQELGDVPGASSLRSFLPAGGAPSAGRSNSLTHPVHLSAIRRVALWVVETFHTEPAGDAMRQILVEAMPARSCRDFFAWNLPLGIMFILQHSLQRRRSSRLVYNFCSALALHIFMELYRPLTLDVRAEKDLRGDFPESAPGLLPGTLKLPISAAAHVTFALPVFILAFGTFLTSQRAAILLCYDSCRLGGARSPDYASASARGGTAIIPKRLVPQGMDVITLMASVVTSQLGTLGFVLFSGLSIVPREIRIDDVVTRLVAALYLRERSIHFRVFSGGSGKQGHKIAWLLRGLLALAAVCASVASGLGPREWTMALDVEMLSTVCCVSLSGIAISTLLLAAERRRRRAGALCRPRGCGEEKR